MLKKLEKLSVGESGQLKKVNGECCVRRSLDEMGVPQGAVVTVKKFAPLGDPIEVTLRGYELTLRKSEAHLIELEVED